ncbi:RTA1 like protein-domain-containing protein [Mycena albidolilacea]|uniref:RTA1 like protein-domain-containing protein n=1 Tax=Mycena albidolilacea TaxID=1033008 RepID=A0AAD7AN32_9AGAR|nr:RTA1 like protein-domain-containing protein [Mycena albidolilacea]
MAHLANSVILTILLGFVAAADAGNGTITGGDQTFSFIPGGFVPKKIPAYIALVAYGISGLIHWIQFFAFPSRRPFMLALTIGMTAMTAGFVVRILFSMAPENAIGKFIAMDLVRPFPCLFLATDYMLLSRLARSFDKEVVGRCLLIRESRIVKIFVWSDVTTFLLQTIGGSSGAGHSPSAAKLGNTLGLAGLVLQAFSFLLFTVVLLTFGWRVSKHFPDLWIPRNARPFKLFSRQSIDNWRVVYYTMCVTCIGVLIRSVFRVAEFAGGYSGTIATHEGYFYFFDALPLWLAMSLYCFLWPVRAFGVRSGEIELIGSAHKGPRR